MLSRLFVLGALRNGPMHGYLVRREALVDQTEAWANVKPGSIYNALHRMNREGLVETIATEQDDGPARTVFGLTDAGRSALRTQIRQALAETPVAADAFDVALRLADEVDRGERESLLRARRDALANRVEVHEASMREVRQYLTEWEVLAFEHVIARLHFERDWMNALITDDGRHEEG